MRQYKQTCIFKYFFVPKSDGAGSNPATSLWTVYNGDNAYADFGNNASVQTLYLHGAGVDNLLGRTNVSTGSTQWYINDHLGSVRRIVDSWGTTLYTANYDVFGNQTATTGSAGDRWGWTGREFDAISGLQYNRARYYDPQSGRWLSKDPIGFAAGDSNLYRYVGNSSTYKIDPSGLQDQTIAGLRLKQAELLAEHLQQGSIGRSQIYGQVMSKHSGGASVVRTVEAYVKSEVPMVTKGEVQIYVEGVPRAIKGMGIGAKNTVVHTAQGAGYVGDTV